MIRKTFGVTPVQQPGTPAAAAEYRSAPSAFRPKAGKRDSALALGLEPTLPIKPTELYGGRWPLFEIVLTVTGISSDDPTVPNPSKEHLLAVHHVGDTSVVLRFADGFLGELDLRDLGLDTPALRIPTMKASEWGGAAEVQDKNWNTIHIDASVLRAKVDPIFADLLRQAIADLG